MAGMETKDMTCTNALGTKLLSCTLDPLSGPKIMI